MVIPKLPLHAFEFGQEASNPSCKSAGRLFPRAPVRPPRGHGHGQNVASRLSDGDAAGHHDLAAQSGCGSVAVVFESSERANYALIEHFGNLVVERNGVNIPVEHCLMEKKHHEPALELADFVANAAGSMARWRLAGKQGFPKDFVSIFHYVPRPYVR